MENNKIRFRDVLKFINKIKDDENGIGDEYECYNIAYQYLTFVADVIQHKYLDYVYNDRDDLLWDLNTYIDDFDEYVMEKHKDKELGLETYEYDELAELNQRIVKHLLPMWFDNCSCYCNLGALREKYDLDVDDLYFDGDSCCIRDRDGNIGYD